MGSLTVKYVIYLSSFNTLRPRQHGRHFADDTFKRILLNENVGMSVKISLNFVPKGPINNIPVLVQIMAWRRPGDKPLSEAMMVNLPMHICITQPQWVKTRPRYNLMVQMCIFGIWHATVILEGVLIIEFVNTDCLLLRIQHYVHQGWF